jgi:hypothetical protein
MTQRSVHPEAESIERALQKLVTHGGHPVNSLPQGESKTGSVSAEVLRGWHGGAERVRTLDLMTARQVKLLAGVDS